MHPQARAWAAQYARLGDGARIVDVGGRNINGSIRDLFPEARTYTAIDLYQGPGVDIVADFLDWTPPEPVDLVLHLEVAEHTPQWREHIAHAATMLRPDGALVLTAAGPGRRPHSAIDGVQRLHPGEHYANLDPDDLRAALAPHYTYAIVRTDPGVPAALADARHPGDVRAAARR